MAPSDPLQYDSELSRAAQRHAEDMANRGYFDHTTPDGVSFVQRIRATDFDGYPAAENIAMGHMTPQDVFDGWMNSPGHCVNIMERLNDSIGFGFYAKTDPRFSYPTNYWVQDFGAH